MRTLEECRAEVFCRSEEKIKKRKLFRNRVLACCIPLCLVVAAVLVMPGKVTQDGAVPEAVPEDYWLQDGVSEGEVSAQSLQICLDDRQIKYSRDPQQVSEIHAFIQKLLGDQAFVGSSLYSDVSNDGQLVPGEDTEIKYSGTFCVYDLTIVQNGTVSRYTLAGRNLKDVQTGVTVTLTENQLDELLKQLEVPNQKEGAQ